MTNPFTHTNIRAIFNPHTQTHYYNANDIVALLIGGAMCKAELCRRAYTQGKRHWHYLKRTLPRFDIMQGQTTRQIKLPCANGKCHFTDVLTRGDILYLIRTIKHPNTQLFKRWLALAKNELSAFRSFFTGLGQSRAVEVLEKLKHRLSLRETRLFKIFDVSQSNQDTPCHLANYPL